MAHGELAWLFFEPVTGLDHCPIILLSCFRATTLSRAWSANCIHLSPQPSHFFSFGDFSQVLRDCSKLFVTAKLRRSNGMRLTFPHDWTYFTTSLLLHVTFDVIFFTNRNGTFTADIVVPEHESSIFRSFIQPCMWFWKCQASSPEAKQYRV